MVAGFQNSGFRVDGKGPKLIAFIDSDLERLTNANINEHQRLFGASAVVS